MERTKATSAARPRILETADRLFYQDGLRAVGIDRIIAEAGVAKMSLYKHFPSQDDLILAVLKYREEKILEFFGMTMERHGKRTKDKLRAFFAALKDWFESPGFRGCAFQNAAVELVAEAKGLGPRRRAERQGTEHDSPGGPDVPQASGSRSDKR